jgi:hypothetical protein
MVYDKFPISVGEFVEHVKCTVAFLDDELAFLNTHALKAGFDSFDDYLDFMYTFYTCYIQIPEKEFFEKWGSLESQQNKIILPPIDTYKKAIFSIEFQNRSRKIQKKASKFSKNVIERITKLELRFPKVLLSMVISKFSYDPNLQAFILQTQKEAYNQLLHLTNNEPLILEMLDYIETFTQPKLHSLIEEKQKIYYYFHDKSLVFQSLHDELLTHKMIVANPFFKESFIELKPKKRLVTLWSASNPELLYLLYHLNNKKDYYQRDSIATIAWNLFN